MTMGHIVGKYSGTLALYFVCVVLYYPILGQGILELLKAPPQGSIGENAVLSCSVSPKNAEVVWLFRDKPVVSSDRLLQTNKTINRNKSTGEAREYLVTNLTIVNTTADDSGNYTCMTKLGEEAEHEIVNLDLSFPAKFVVPAIQKFKYNASEHANATLRCGFEVYNASQVEWWKEGSDEHHSQNATKISLKQIESTFDIIRVGNDANGTYICQIYDSVTATNVTGNIHVIVYDKPIVMLDQVIGISRTELFFNWTISAFNSEIEKYYSLYSVIEKGQLQGFTNYGEKISKNSTSFVMKGLKNSTDYVVKLSVKTNHGENHDQKFGRTLDIDPVFVPNISINGFSATSVTIGWAAPPKEIEHLIHYYLLEARKKDGGMPRKAYHSRDARNLPYMFDNLEPHSTYIFKARACQDFTKLCGNWSEEMEAATLDGMPGRPSDVAVNCTASQLFLNWQTPLKPNAEIKGYMMELTGIATYKDRSGALKKVTWGPLSRFMSNDSKYVRFDDLQPNTNYTVRLSAMTRTRRRGEEEVKQCTTWVTPPDGPPRPRWRKILENDRYMFKMHLPKVSERNGPICCYRVYMVRMLNHMDLKDLKSQRQLEIIEYAEAHAVQPTLGAYITDIFTNDNFPTEGEILMGDNKTQFNKSDPALSSGDCSRCLQRPQRAHIDPPRPTTTVATTTEEVDDDLFTTEPGPLVEDATRQRRSYISGGDYGNNPMMSDPMKLVDDEREAIKVEDGRLDSEANYTLFVELIPGKKEDDPMYSDYVNMLRPAPSPVAPAPSTALEIALQVTCAVAAVVLLVMIVFCVLQTRRSRKMPPHAHVELNPLQYALRYVVGHMGGRQQLVSSTPPDMPPIAKEDLAAAYAERHADSDYGFQKEFELLQMLSECFPDRSTHASEARENQPKNRYPDIKAYDQTRVKLSQVDGITGSDYINANFVVGYKERKKFICAQGPTDTTVNDFWRMIWEHGLELIVMLTNLEEYSKVKCSKYWPDGGTRAFGGVTVHHVQEKRYSDYIVRELRITKQPTNSEGQPIVENNGVAKRNGDIKEPSESVPTSPRELKDTAETRTVRQYHFLMWKDFAAPEHPHSILKFIKRVNEAWSNMVGRPVVVHCSAGVGRTGTLVALDCLLEQLTATGHATVFNTIAELRRQRNFLVQSQKQYVFVYRALVEYAHYGDTEIPASRLKNAIDRLRNTPEGADKCLMEHDFEKMLDPPVAEALKSCAAGQADELRTRNRSTECLPYDRNRVMLTPIPGREYSTYINASFVEAYDNSEGFIITQDPLPNTVFDFWRMVSEQSVSTIVMLSELGDGKCPRYWDDGTAQYEHIAVQYDDSEPCPYYTRRQFRLTNNKSGHTSSVRQLQYQGWPTAPGHVPEVTRGLAELADACAPSGDALGPMVVHCNSGTERSALFVALCVLICQLRTERRVDVSATARKVRSQRARTIDTFTQYEFLHRAILNYAELHNLLEDS